MPDDLTDFQVALLCAIEEHDDSEATSDQKRDLARLLHGGYVQPTGGRSRVGLRDHSQGAALLGELGARAE